MNEQAMSGALDRIHDIAVKLLSYDVPREVEEGLHAIVSVARYRFDVLSSSDAGTPGGE